jgi:pimeloyl-ACP methyl ester carboxylesterase
VIAAGMVISSKVWTAKDKTIALLGGPLVVLVAGSLGAAVVAIFDEEEPPEAGSFFVDAGIPWFPVLIFALLISGPLVGAPYLAWRLRRAGV